MLILIIGVWLFFIRSAQPSGLLTTYQLTDDPVAIIGLENNASGLAYSTSTNTLFLVGNNPEIILELSLDGKVLRTITLTGFEDTEGIAYVGGQKFVILEERRSTVNFVSIPSDVSHIDKSEANSFSLNIFTNSKKNLRLEGITIDHATGDIYLVKEKSPRALYKISGLLDNKQSVDVSIPWDIEKNSSNIADLSGVVFEPRLRRLLVLSHESFSLSEFGLDGEYFSSLNLKRSKHALHDDIPQAEGVALTADGTLYIVSEPNLLYRFVSEGTEVISSTL